MNIHTFKDAVTSKRSALSHDLDEDDDDEEVGVSRREVDGEEEGGKEKFNEIGEVIEPFNLRNERDGGHFDKNMNYVFSRDKGEVDTWVADMDEASMEIAIGEAAQAMKRKEARKQILESSQAMERKTPKELKEELLTFVSPGETVTATMRRFSTKPVQIKKKTSSADQSIDKTTLIEQKEKQKQNRLKIDRITEITDQLISNGLTGILSMTYESIENSLSLWEYKGPDGAVYGPFSAQQISQWKAQGYFTGETAVQVRKVRVKSVLDEGLSGRKVKFSEKFGASNGVDIYSDNDLTKSKDILSEPLAKRGRAEDGGSVSIKTNTENDEKKENEWIGSDDVDFGDFVELNNSSMPNVLNNEVQAEEEDGKNDEIEGDDDNDDD